MRVVLSIACVFVLACTTVVVQAQHTVESVRDATLDHHDPAEAFFGRIHRFTLRETRPGAADRITTVTLDYPAESFTYRSERDGHVLEGRLEPALCEAWVDGSTDISMALREKYRLTCEGLAWLRDYYGYMHSLPMNLRDQGIYWNPDVKRVTFAGQEALALRYTYDAEVGSDIWDLFVDPTTFETVGCRFYHDESKNDGEYIVFEGEVAVDGMRLPRTLHWYTNAEGKFLGADEVVDYQVSDPDESW